MSFFKFRQGGADAPAPTPGKKPRAGKAATASTESVEVMRRRARRRLIGSVVLVLAAIIVFPLVFDTQPRPVSSDIAIEIPSREATAPLQPETHGRAVPGLDQDEEEVVAQAEEPATTDAPEAPAPAAAPIAPVAPTPPARSEPAPAPARPAATAPKPATAPPAAAAKPTPPAAAATPAKPAPAPAAPARSSDAERARALLEGRSPAAASAAAASGQSFVVQVGAFADANKALEVRQRIERSGFKTYTQVAQTADGARTRVRVGPFKTRAEAEQAAGKVKSLGLPTSVFGL